jgi:hypothetical protein
MRQRRKRVDYIEDVVVLFTLEYYPYIIYLLSNGNLFKKIAGHT